MKVKITNGSGWYADMEGSTFETVSRHEEGNYPGYVVEFNGNRNNFLVRDGNYVVVDEQTGDAINSPNHYNSGRFETIEIIEEITQGYDDGFVAHCAGTAIKYISRAPHKHESPTEDLRKAAKYLEFAIERLESTKEDE